MSTFQAVQPESCTALINLTTTAVPLPAQALHRAPHSHPWDGQSSHRAACTECWQHSLCSNDPQNAFLTPCWMHSSSTAVALSAVPPFSPDHRFLCVADGCEALLLPFPFCFGGSRKSAWRYKGITDAQRWFLSLILQNCLA